MRNRENIETCRIYLCSNLLFNLNRLNVDIVLFSSVFFESPTITVKHFVKRLPYQNSYIRYCRSIMFILLMVVCKYLTSCYANFFLLLLIHMMTYSTNTLVGGWKVGNLPETFASKKWFFETWKNREESVNNV